VYVGHFAAGLALKTAEPKAPTWGLLLGVGLLDLLFGPFILLGIEHASITPGVSPGFSLDFIDWSHSLAMSLVWSVLFALFFLRRGRRVAAFLGLAVFSHFLLDLPMHPGDLALWPHAATHLGFGLWTSLPRGWWFVELGVIAAAWGWYAWKARTASTFGGRPIAVGLVLLVLHIANAPWLQ
jgi:membrane-bound metal-dependent hydrolase YbcI (DUF457 family)